MKTIKWGMIGCGNVTEVKSGPAFYKSNNSMLYGITNRTIQKAYDYAKRHTVQQVFETAEQLINDCDAVYIATPPESHKHYALMCAEAEKPCYIEKPMALNYNECLEITEAFKRKNVKGFVAYYRRKLERFIKAKELVESGALGNVHAANIKYMRPITDDEIKGCWRTDSKISGGGLFMDMAVHALDALDFIFGEISEAKGFTNRSRYYATEDTVCAIYKFKAGASGVATWCFDSSIRCDKIEIIGDKASLEFECFGTTPLELISKDGITKIDVFTPQHIQQNLIQSIVDELNGVGECPSTIYTALRTAKVCDMIYGNL